MDANPYGTDSGRNDSNIPSLPSMPVIQELGDIPVTIPLDQLQNLQGRVHQLMNTTSVSSQHVSEQRAVIGELVTFSHNMHTSVLQLNERIAKVEYENVQFKTLLTPEASFEANNPLSNFHHEDADTYSGGSSFVRNLGRDRAEHSIDESILRSTIGASVTKPRARKQLTIKIPVDSVKTAPVAGLPTPVKTGTGLLTNNFPKTPITPSRIGPFNGNKRSTTLTHKRSVHNLDKIMPPSHARIPLLPLTDTEVIVYFFQSLSRPIVALRLYARNWGPAAIVHVLNDHRQIEPAYLRNTCSVKCTTSIKKGKDQFGEDWETAHREVFKDADDIKATDLIQLSGDELQDAVDCDLRSFCVSLKKHPRVGVDGGMFTRCVKYCQETDECYTIDTVWKLAAKLEQDGTSQGLSSPLDSLPTTDPGAPSLDSAMPEAEAIQQEDST